VSALERSPWLIHYDGSSCNGCDIEVLACLTPIYDAERFGCILTGAPKQADILLVTGSVNNLNAPILKNIYDQMPQPRAVVAIGACAYSGGVFAEGYNIAGGVATVIPVDVYVPGCAARPEAILDGVVAAAKILRTKERELRAARRTTKNTA
jgi:ech hydrogenase subunit C